MAVPLTTIEFFAAPLIGLIIVGGLVLFLRWAFSRGDSLVRRSDTTPAPRDTFGLLIDIRTTDSYSEARRLVERLTAAKIKATAAHTTEGWTVYVWPADEAAARDIARSP
jgi:hypothetical protein